MKNWLKRFKKWRGPKLKWYAELVWLLDEALDHVPGYWAGTWHSCGLWGCALHLSRFWSRPEFEIAAPKVQERHL